MRFLTKPGTRKAAATAKTKAKVPPRRPLLARLPRWIRPAARHGALAILIGSVGIGGTVLWHGGYLADATGLVTGQMLALSGDLGLGVQEVLVDGRRMTNQETVLKALGVGRGTPILAVDPIAAKERLESLTWVKSASVERRLPDTIYVAIVERSPLAVWQRHGRLVLIDREGVVIASERLDRFPGLPLVVGEDAPKHAAALIDFLGTEPDLRKRITAAVRVANRRWNLKLDNGIDVQLPEENPAAAYAQLAKLDRTQALLKRDVQMVDLRLPDRLIVRTNAPEAPKDAAKKPKTQGKST